MRKYIKEPQTFIFRVDASLSIGLGHILRCISLAQEIHHRGGQACFIMADYFAPAKKLLESKKFELILINVEAGDLTDAKTTSDLAISKNAEWIVVDGYHFDGEYQEALSTGPFRTALIEDQISDAPLHSHVVINQCVVGAEVSYSKRNASCKTFLGPKFALLSKELLQYPQTKKDIPPIAQKILVTLGGTDPHGVCKQVLQAILKLEHRELRIIALAGANSLNLRELEDLARSDQRIKVMGFIEKMSEMIQGSDLAISACGGTAWQLAYFGVPTLLIKTADNQNSVADLLDGKMGFLLGEYSSLTSQSIISAIDLAVRDKALREKLSLGGQALVDGKGAERIANEFFS